MQNSDKISIQKYLIQGVEEISKWIEESTEDFNAPLMENKWSTAQHIYHLIKIARHVNKGMKMPRILLVLKFGKLKRPEKTYKELFNQYQEVLKQNAISPLMYCAESKRTFEKKLLMEKFQYEYQKINSHLEKWDEKKLSRTVFPHVGLGKISIREMMFYLIFHNKHHFKAIKNRSKIKRN